LGEHRQNGLTLRYKAAISVHHASVPARPLSSVLQYSTAAWISSYNGGWDTLALCYLVVRQS